jgi:multiple sugar transport system ATP-binding protein
VDEVAGLLGIGGLLDHFPAELSMSQRQRVAIARASARRPKLLLLDEPLSNLTAQQRDDLRAEIKRAHDRLGTTTIYVTQDQGEAMTLAEHIILMRNGQVEQQGAPLSLFQYPATRFVAGFLGLPAMNFLPGMISRALDRDAIHLDGGGLVVSLPPNRLPKGVEDGRRVVLGIRPEHMMRAVRVSPPDGSLRYDAEIELVQSTGSRIFATFRMGGEPVVAELQAYDASRPGERVPIDINLKRASIFDAATEKAL